MAEELIDVLDEHGNKTGVVLPRSEVHEKELRHASVFVWIYNSKGEVLLQHRAKDKKIFSDVWDVSVAGHITAGDEPVEAAIREVSEEIGIAINPSELIQVDYTFDVAPWPPDKTHPEFCWVYILQKELDPKKLAIQYDELSAVRLESIDALEAARKQAGHEKIYANRNTRIYDVAFAEIRKRLHEG
ncbi:MAG TPA: NUDIX domain-containing protein [Candidatus Saccharimonadales bacterium]|nr:NUDIX domain-containing protein [Candidatus Saccharimonadales bacterium]